MTTLHDRLTDLAGEAPPGGAVPGLWDRARRAHRRRRIGTVAIVVVVLLGLGAIATLDWSRSRQTPAPADSAPALPQKIWSPSRWLPGTDEEGPLGRLAAIQDATRAGWTGTRDGVAGISALTGEYRFLDLPDAVLSGNDVALAPDGRHVAYWYTGETQESPNSGSGPVVGVAVYDTTTGEVVRHPVPTEHGLMVDDRLVWADAGRVVFGYYQYDGGDADDEMSQNSGRDASGLMVWEPASGSPATRVPRAWRGSDVEATTGEGRLLLDDGAVSSVDLDRPLELSGPSHLRPGRGFMFVSALDEAGERVAWVGGQRNPNEIRVAPLREGRVTGRVVPDSGRTFAVQAWLDEHHVAAVRRLKGIGPSALMSVDVRTGESSVLVRLPLNSYGGGTQLATELLSEPTVERLAPPRPLDPRWVAGAEVAVALLGVGALLLWRRRHVRP